jgi:hypothetical protein
MTRETRRSFRGCAGSSRSRMDPAVTTPASAPTRPMLLAELVALGREAWRISELERAVRAEIEALREAEENEWLTKADCDA